MVCYVSEENSSTMPSENILEDTIAEVNLNDDSDVERETNKNDESEYELKLHRIAGGSLIEYPPLFSLADEESLFIINRNIVYVYSAATSELIKTLSANLNDDLIKIEFTNSKNLIGCTTKAEIVEWKWKTGAVEYSRKLNLPFKEYVVESFNLLDISANTACALITFRVQSTQILQWAIINLENGKKLNCPLDIKLKSSNALIMTDTLNFHYFIIAQNSNLHVVNYKNWDYKILRNANDVHVTSLINHPSREMFATGDKMGRIFLWPDFWNNHQNQKVKSVLYHWHHTPISSVAFTESGSGFYSGGQEAVLVKWNIDKPDIKDFLPRLPAPIKHIAVGPRNKNIAVCTVDNGILIIGPQGQTKCVLQNFTYVRDHPSNLDKYPIGLICNPRNNSIVLNGQTGSLQFFSTSTNSLLYNMDIICQNRLSDESRILYDIKVTKTAMNRYWMATGEVWNDQQHTPELRLKFWEYKEKDQTYHLNTSIELPHENNFKCIEFSSKYESDNLLCASVGSDNQIKVWSLVKSNNIYKKDSLVWCCIAVKKYKDLPCNCLSFSEDGSLLAASFGNNLCILKSDTLKIKSILTAPSAYDSNLQKIQIQFNKKQKKINDQIIENKKKKLSESFQKYLENNSDNCLVNLIKYSKSKAKNIKENLVGLSKDDKQLLFKSVQEENNLNLFQKLKVYQKLGIACKVSDEYKSKMMKYLKKKNLFIEKIEKELHQDILKISKSNLFKAKYRLRKYMNHKINENSLISILSLLNLNNSDDENSVIEVGKSNKILKQEICHNNSHQQNFIDIKFVNFCVGEFSHLAIVGTDHRLIVWNLLTLRMESVLKISVHHMIVDPISNLCAVFTNLNELYVFLPYAPLPIYHKTGLPNIYGGCWIPRKYPKPQSINVDWQSFSTLYFLTNKQELMVLSRGDEVNDNIMSTAFLNEPKETLRFSIFGTEAINKTKTKNTNKLKTNKLMVANSGKSAIKYLIEMANHTMGPINLLCHNFIESLMIIESNPKKIEQNNSEENYSSADMDSDKDENNDADMDDKSNLNIKLRKILQNKIKDAEDNISSSNAEYLNYESITKNINKEKIQIEF